MDVQNNFIQEFHKFHFILKTKAKQFEVLQICIYLPKVPNKIFAYKYA